MEAAFLESKARIDDSGSKLMRPSHLWVEWMRLRDRIEPIDLHLASIGREIEASALGKRFRREMGIKDIAFFFQLSSDLIEATRARLELAEVDLAELTSDAFAEELLVTMSRMGWSAPEGTKGIEVLIIREITKALQAAIFNKKSGTARREIPVRKIAIAATAAHLKVSARQVESSIALLPHVIP
jgi:hypothetical protein